MEWLSSLSPVILIEWLPSLSTVILDAISYVGGRLIDLGIDKLVVLLCVLVFGRNRKRPKTAPEEQAHDPAILQTVNYYSQLSDGTNVVAMADGTIRLALPAEVSFEAVSGAPAAGFTPAAVRGRRGRFVRG